MSYIYNKFKNMVLMAKDKTALKNWTRTTNNYNELIFELKKESTTWRICFTYLSVLDLKVVIKIQRLKLHIFTNVSEVNFNLNSDSKNMINAIKYILSTMNDQK
jgi:hypothetical protein